MVTPPPSGALRPSSPDSTGQRLGRGLGSTLASALLSLGPRTASRQPARSRVCNGPTPHRTGTDGFAAPVRLGPALHPPDFPWPCCVQGAATGLWTLRPSSALPLLRAGADEAMSRQHPRSRFRIRGSPVRCPSPRSKLQAGPVTKYDGGRSRESGNHRAGRVCAACPDCDHRGAAPDVYTNRRNCIACRIVPRCKLHAN